MDNENNNNQDMYGTPTPLNAQEGTEKTSSGWAENATEYQGSYHNPEMNAQQEQPQQEQPQQEQPNYNQQNGSSAGTNYYQNNYQPGVNYNAQNQMNQQGGEKGSGFAIASMVLGIISLITFCMVINIPLAILAIIFGAIALVRHTKKGMAIAGLVTGIISIVLFVIVIAIAGIGLSSLMRSGDLNDILEQYQENGTIEDVPDGVLPDGVNYDGQHIDVHFE